MTEREEGILEGLQRAARRARDAANRSYGGNIVEQAREMGLDAHRLAYVETIAKATRLAWETFAEEIEKEVEDERLRFSQPAPGEEA